MRLTFWDISSRWAFPFPNSNLVPFTFGAEEDACQLSKTTRLSLRTRPIRFPLITFSCPLISGDCPFSPLITVPRSGISIRILKFLLFEIVHYAILRTFSVRDNHVLLLLEYFLDCLVPQSSGVGKNPAILINTDLPKICPMVDRL